jgi:exodeoxyribonuclease V beta subunit
MTDRPLADSPHIAPFHLDMDLPIGGRMLLEASAGTGKTYSLTALVARYVAEQGLAIEQLLLVTFTRAAAGELRERTRERLLEAAAALRSGTPVNDDTPAWLAPICRVDDDERSARLGYVEQALANLDTATITTIHGFAQQALREAGLRSGVASNAQVVEGQQSAVVRKLRDDLISELASDFDALGPVTLTHGPNTVEARIRSVLKALSSNTGATALPTSSDDEVACRWATFAGSLLEQLRELRVEAGELDYDDLITTLHRLVHDRTIGPAVGKALRDRYRLVMIDEFQDTDAHQWEAFTTVFHPDDVDELFLGLVVVGDPKQAIYRFRGADIDAYLRAVGDEAMTRFRMDRNWRSDADLVTALNAFFNGCTFGHPEIGYVEVDTPASAAQRSLTGAGAPLQLRWLDTDDEKLGATAVRRAIAADVADHVVDLLSNATIGERRVRPGDICLLVRANDDALPLVEALNVRGVPVVKSRLGSVLASAASTQLRILLAALADPSDARRARAMGLGWFARTPLLELVTEESVADLQTRCRSWAHDLTRTGILSFHQQLRGDRQVITSLASFGDIERNLTDLEHLVELLHADTRGRPLPAGALLARLDELIAGEEDSDANTPEATMRRIESDAAAVQITTQHGSKGLEYPIVLVPFAKGLKLRQPFYFSDGGERFVDAAPYMEWVGHDLTHDDRKALASNAEIGDELRLLYVTCTRARHQLVLWWGTFTGADKSALSRVLFGTTNDLELTPPKATSDICRSRFTELVDRVGPTMSVHAIGVDTAHGRPAPDPDATPDFMPTVATAPPQTAGRPDWQRWSFSTLSRTAADDDAVAHGAAGGFDEGDTEPSDVPTSGDGIARSMGRLWDLPAGPAFGTLVHEVLERVDFTSDDLTDDLARAARARGSGLIPGIVTADLATGLADALATPLDGLVDGFPLTRLVKADRRDELEFHFALDATRVAAAELADIAAADDDPTFRQYFTSLGTAWRAGEAQHVQGVLTGSIDLLMRASNGDHHRYFVCDYKSNRLHPPENRTGGTWYGRDGMAGAMAAHHYPLQALIYCVALHRFLGLRVPDYSFDTHHGGAGYLFVRGMHGSETAMVGGVRDGVFAWRPSRATVEAADSLLGGAS